MKTAHRGNQKELFLTRDCDRLKTCQRAVRQFPEAAKFSCNSVGGSQRLEVQKEPAASILSKLNIFQLLRTMKLYSRHVLRTKKKKQLFESLSWSGLVGKCHRTTPSQMRGRLYGFLSPFSRLLFLILNKRKCLNFASEKFLFE